MTNFEKIKTMSVKELAKLLEQRWFGTKEEVENWLKKESN
jgi:hypothetical protein